MSRGTEAIISLDALQHNYALVRQYAPNSRVLCVVKADAYGHGLVPVAKALRQSDAFGVATMDEALALREAGISQPIVLMEGVMKPAELDVACQKRFQIVVHQEWQLNMLLQRSLATALTVWLKIDTGMHRLGVDCDHAQSYLEQLKASQNVKQVVLMSHLACADEPRHPLTESQHGLFDQMVLESGCDEASLANSAAILGGTHLHYQWVRPGLMLYGGSPLGPVGAADLRLRPVMQLVSKVIALNTVGPGESVGYGGSWVAKKNTDVAVVAIGYGDGYPRHVNDQACVLIEGELCPVIGPVSMDMITVDVSKVPQVKVDSDVVLWGDGLGVEQVAQWANTINYELLCQVTGRVQRRYIS